MHISIPDLISRISNGDIRIPAFQRDYVWDAEQAAFLLDSIYKKYPIGTVILWKTDERLKSEKRLGSFDLPDPAKSYPVNYVLDGQQRITSIFSTFQNKLIPVDDNWVDIYFDLTYSPETHESAFLPLRDEEVDNERHFPLKHIFNPGKYANAIAALADDQDKVQLVSDMAQRFFQYQLPSEVFDTEDRSQVAIVFERINRAGTELDLFELLSAWSWSEEFDLVKSFEDLQNDISDHGFSGLIGHKDLQLKVCSAVISGKTTPKDIIDLSGDDIRNKFPIIKNGVIGAIDFLKRELSVPTFEMLPFPSMIVPLAAYFATDKANGQNLTDLQRKKLVSWFWNTSLGRRYSSDINEKHAQDIAVLSELRNNENCDVSSFQSDLRIDFERANFSMQNGHSRAFVLMLNQEKPRSFLSGISLDLEKSIKKGSSSDFHHIFPKAHLASISVDKRSANVLANICFLSRSDNNAIKDKSPNDYAKSIGEDRDIILKSSHCPLDFDAMEYKNFVSARSEMLKSKALELMKL